jgi:ribosomal protein L18E
VLTQRSRAPILKVSAHKVSASAREQIIAAGGSVILIEIPSHPKTKRAKKSQDQEA